jgi:hypothetical protein
LWNVSDNKLAAIALAPIDWVGDRYFDQTNLKSGTSGDATILGLPSKQRTKEGEY